MLGGTNVVDHVAQDGSNAVAVATEVDDVAGLMATLSSPPPEVGAIMERHGVVPPLTICVEQERGLRRAQKPAASNWLIEHRLGRRRAPVAVTPA